MNLYVLGKYTDKRAINIKLAWIFFAVSASVTCYGANIQKKQKIKDFLSYF